MLMSGKNELQKMKRHTYFIASLLVFPGCSARYVFMCSLTKRLYADGARLAFPSADKDVNIRAYTSEMGVPTFFGLGIGATSSCLGRGFCRGCSEEVKKREVTEYILPIAVLAIPSECSANERKGTLLYYQSRGLNILERETRSTESACHHGVTCQGPCATRSKHSIYLFMEHSPPYLLPQNADIVYKYPSLAAAHCSFTYFSQPPPFVQSFLLSPSSSILVAMMARSALSALVAFASITYVAGQSVTPAAVPTFPATPLASIHYAYTDLACIHLF